MQTDGKAIFEWNRQPRMPVPPPPPGSCDCQFHIYEEPGKFPPVEAFWSGSLYNAEGYYERNSYNA